MEPVRRWLAFKLVQIANRVHGELFMRLCEVAVMAKFLDQMDAQRLEQEHYYDYNHERETDDTDSNTTHNINATNKTNRKLH